MPVETATYISDLNGANPTHTDGLNQIDSHLRLIKSVLKTTLPNVNAAVTATPAQLNATTGAFSVAGILKAVAAGVSGVLKLGPVAGAGSVLMANNATNGTSGGLLISMNDSGDANPLQAAALDRAGNLVIAGALTAASIKKGGNELLPTGIICMWSGSSASIPAGWHICNGVSGTPNLLDKFIVNAGLTYAVAQTGGATAVTAATDTQGLHNHGATTGSAGPFAITGSADSQGAHSHGGSSGSVALTVAQMPAHDHGLGSLATFTAPGTGFAVGGGASVSQTGVLTQGGGAGHSHSISSDGAHAHNVTVSNAPAHAHSVSNDGSHAHNVTVATLPPFYALCYIMKL